MQYRVSKQNQSKRRRGAAVIELALVVPFLLFLTIGTVEICELIFLNQSMKISAYEGARVAVVPGSNQYDIETQVGEIAAIRNIDAPTVRIVPSNFQDLKMGEFVTVEVSLDVSDRHYFSNLFQETERRVSVSMMKEFD